GKLDKELADRRAEVAQAPEVANLKDIEQAANEVQVQERVFAAAAAKLVISGEGEFEVDGEVQQTDDNTQTIQLRDGMKFAFGKLDKELADRRAEVAQAPEVANLKDIEQAANEV
ncbi:ATP-binding protein, partial [Bacteroides fragilis]|nr:ATP-binding protein [Bacteroides fragilis]